MIGKGIDYDYGKLLFKGKKLKGLKWNKIRNYKTMIIS